MTTKEQERQAIEKIRKIVEGLGADSYVGTAMAGVLEVAEQNIEFDAAFSLKAQVELAEKEAAELKKTVEQQENKMKFLADELKELREKSEKIQEEAEQRKMYDWMYDRIETMAGAEGRRLEREKEKLAEKMAAAIMDKRMEQADKEKVVGEYRKNSLDIIELERFQRAFKEKYEEDFTNG